MFLSGNKVTIDDINESIKQIDFDVLKDGKTTVCTLTLYNGFTVRGESSVVDPANFNKDLGEQYAEQSARNNVWPVLGAILADRLWQSRMNFNPTFVPAQDEVGPSTLGIYRKE